MNEPSSLLSERALNADADEAQGPLVDRLGRVHNNLRVSVTDRCNIRCFYCMPAEQVEFRPREELLSFEEIERFARAVAPLGVRRLRLTGGEPLLRRDLHELIRRLAVIEGIDDVALTTNGMLLADQADALQQAGLRRINISLDTLREDVFQRISRRSGLDQVLAGVAAAQQAGFSKIRLNALAIRNLTEPEILPLARFARDRRLELRFIEFMPLDAAGQWQQGDVLTGAAVRSILEAEFGRLEAVCRTDASQPAIDFAYSDRRGRVGFINPVSQPFCESCNRLRLTAEGQVRNCLFSHAEWDARALLRAGADDHQLRALVRQCVAAKAPAHGIGDAQFVQPSRAMYQIGG